MYSPWENKLPHTYVNRWRGAPAVKTWLPTIVVGGDAECFNKNDHSQSNLMRATRATLHHLFLKPSHICRISTFQRKQIVISILKIGSNFGSSSAPYANTHLLFRKGFVLSIKVILTAASSCSKHCCNITT